MDAEEELLWLVLLRLVRGDQRKLHRLLKLSRDPLHILKAPSGSWRQLGLPNDIEQGRRDWSGAQRAEAKRIQSLLRSMDATTLVLGEACYPDLLGEIYDPPVLLFARGAISLLQKPSLAIVGSRKASAAGLRTASELGGACAEAGLVVVSGLALGIDAAAHRGCLERSGGTIAVMACGIDQVYPRQHVALHSSILERGVVISEFAPGTPARRQHFPQRNRIVSGLSLGVLLIEAAERSGSLITARLALEQNREVFCVPHSIYHREGEGCNRLIKEGACMVREAEDIFFELGFSGANYASQSREIRPLPSNKLARDLLQLLSGSSHSLDELAMHTTLSVSTLSQTLTELEFEGWVDCRQGRYVVV